MSVHREQWDEERCSGKLCVQDCESCPYKDGGEWNEEKERNNGEIN